MQKQWLDPKTWLLVQTSVPVCCVDVLPLQISGEKRRRITAVGLIYRNTPDKGKCWCLVGGRLWRNESLAEGVDRQIRETLGDGVRFPKASYDWPIYVAQYFTVKGKGVCHDARQHAMGHTFCVPIEGDPQPQGEAFKFEWFAPTKLPPARRFGFGQDAVVAECLKRYRVQLRSI